MILDNEQPLRAGRRQDHRNRLQAVQWGLFNFLLKTGRGVGSLPRQGSAGFPAVSQRPHLWMASYVMDFRPPYFSSTLKAAATGIRVYDVHNFLTCDLGHGEIVIDITFPASLERYGFPVTTDWDGKSDFRLCCTPQERIELDSPESVSECKHA